MTRSLSQIKEDSRNSLAGNYLLYFFVIVLTGLLTMAANQIVSFLAWPFGNAGFFLLTLVNLILDFLVMILAKMLQAGQLFLALNIARFNRVSAGDLFLAFRYDTAKAFRLCAILALVETICRAPFSVSLSNLVYVGAFTINSGKNVPVWSILLLSLCGLAGMIFLEVMVAFPLSQALFLYIDHQRILFQLFRFRLDGAPQDHGFGAAGIFSEPFLCLRGQKPHYAFPDDIRRFFPVFTGHDIQPAVGPP